MDLLKKELERKKQALLAATGTADNVSSGKRQRYVKAGLLRQRQGEIEAELKQKKARIDSDNNCRNNEKANQSSSTGVLSTQSNHEIIPQQDEQLNQMKADNDKPLLQHEDHKDIVSNGNADKKINESESHTKIDNPPKTNTKQQLRSLGMPICLFGETSAARFDRLTKALKHQQQVLSTLSEKMEFSLRKEHNIRNSFLEKDNSDGVGKNRGSISNLQKENSTADGINTKAKTSIDDKDFEISKDSDVNDPFIQICIYFKGLLDEWEDDLAKRPDAVKHSMAGKNEVKTYKQCKDYIRPLFKLCKKKKLEGSQKVKILEIVHYCQAGEFVKANDTYMDVAIGRAPWPIGVTQVGIHSRTGRSKIESQNVAHVMNSELQRKYLTSIKRLMTYAQKKRDDVNHSKKVL